MFTVADWPDFELNIGERESSVLFDIYFINLQSFPVYKANTTILGICILTLAGEVLVFSQ